MVIVRVTVELGFRDGILASFHLTGKMVFYFKFRLLHNGLNVVIIRFWGQLQTVGIKSVFLLGSKGCGITV